jgi:hypothetical protein
LFLFWHKKTGESVFSRREVEDESVMSGFVSRASIFVGTPCYGGVVTHIYMQSIIKLIGYGSHHGLTFNLGLLAHDSLITRCRNSLVAAFLDAASSTHLMFIDADIGFEPEAVERLIGFDVEVVAGVYPLKVIHWPQARQRLATANTPEDLARTGLNYVGVVCQDDDKEERDGFVTGKYAGTGFMLIKRSAIEKMVSAYPETKYNEIQTYPVPKVPAFTSARTSPSANTGAIVEEKYGSTEKAS